MKMHRLPLDTRVHFAWIKHKLTVESTTLVFTFLRYKNEAEIYWGSIALAISVYETL